LRGAFAAQPDFSCVGILKCEVMMMLDFMREKKIYETKSEADFLAAKSSLTAAGIYVRTWTRQLLQRS